MPLPFVVQGMTSRPPPAFSLSLLWKTSLMISLSPRDSKRLSEIICTPCQVATEPAWHVPLGTRKLVLGPPVTTAVIIICVLSYLTVRKQEIIKVTEQLIEAISNGDFESYT